MEHSQPPEWQDPQQLSPAGGEALKLPREIWVLVVSTFIIALGYGIIAPVLPRFAASFGVTFTATSAVVSAFAFARLVFAPAGGYLTNRFGERKIFLVGVVVVALSVGAAAFARNYEQLLLFRGAGGIGSVMFTVASTTLVIRLSPPKARGRASAVVGSAFLIGTVAGPAVGTALSGLGMRTPFIIYMVALLLAGAIVAVLLPKGQHLAAARDKPLPAMTVTAAWKKPTYRAVCISGFVNGWANLGMRSAIVPLFAASLPNAADWSAGALLTGAAIGSVVVLPLAGRLADRHGRRLQSLLGLVGFGLLTIVMGISTSIWVALALIVLAGMSIGFFQPSQQAALADVIGNQRSGGAVTAFYSMIFDLGAIVGPLVAGVVADQWGFEWTFAMGAALVFFAAMWWGFTREEVAGGTRARTH